MTRSPRGRCTAVLAGAAWLACTGVPGGAAESAAPQPGLYESDDCEASRTPEGTVQHVRRRLDVGPDGSAWQLTVYADEGCSRPLLRVRGRTQATVLGPARHVPRAVAVRVRFLDRTAVAYGAEMAALLAGMGCGRAPWAVGVEQAIGQGRCLGMPPIETCHFDHDVLRIEGDRLYTGQRAGDGTLCTPDREPAALNPAPLRRR